MRGKFRTKLKYRNFPCGKFPPRLRLYRGQKGLTRNSRYSTLFSSVFVAQNRRHGTQPDLCHAIALWSRPCVQCRRQPRPHHPPNTAMSSPRPSPLSTREWRRDAGGHTAKPVGQPPRQTAARGITGAPSVYRGWGAIKVSSHGAQTRQRQGFCAGTGNACGRDESCWGMSSGPQRRHKSVAKPREAPPHPVGTLG